MNQQPDPTYYSSPIYGEGRIISETETEIIVQFDNPPGMVHTGKAQVVPIIHFMKERKQ